MRESVQRPETGGSHHLDRSTPPSGSEKVLEVDHSSSVLERPKR